MRVLLESPSCNPHGGSNAAVGFGWATHLAAHVEVHVLVSDPVFRAGGPRAQTLPFTVHPVPATGFARLGTMLDFAITARRMRAAVFRDVQPDIVHSVEPGGWIGPRALATRTFPYVVGPLNGGATHAPRSLSIEVMEGLPVHPVRNLLSGRPRALAVNLLNEAVFGSDLPTARMLGRAALRKARRVVLATDVSPDALRAHDRAKVARMGLLGLDLELFAPRPRATPTGPLRALYAGRITPSKGLHLVVEALARTDATLDIAGPVAEGWYADHCGGLVMRLGLSDRVRWLGALPREQLALTYASADVYVMPSLWEPYGMTYAEAMACGTPVVGLATGGVPQVVAPGTGWLLRPTTKGDVVDQLAARLSALADDREQVRAAGTAARAHAVTTWSWDRLVEQMLQVYSGARA